MISIPHLKPTLCSEQPQSMTNFPIPACRDRNQAYLLFILRVGKYTCLRLLFCHKNLLKSQIVGRTKAICHENNTMSDFNFTKTEKLQLNVQISAQIPCFTCYEYFGKLPAYISVCVNPMVIQWLFITQGILCKGVFTWIWLGKA